METAATIGIVLLVIIFIVSQHAINWWFRKINVMEDEVIIFIFLAANITSLLILYYAFRLALQTFGQLYCN